MLQGTIQGALYGAKALAQGIGPLIFASLFSAFTRSDSRLPFFPGGWPADMSDRFSIRSYRTVYCEGGHTGSGHGCAVAPISCSVVFCSALARAGKY